MILHPTDFSSCANAALQVACSLARQRCVPVIVLHVVPPARRESSPAIEAKHRRVPELWQALREIRARQQDVWIEPVLRRGSPAPVILETAREAMCDLIVVGMQGAGEAAQRMGSIATHVAENAVCTVLCVRSPAEPAEGFEINMPEMPAGSVPQWRRFGFREAG